MALEIRTTDQISDIAQDDWEKLSRGRSFSSYSWYQMGERVLAQVPRTYVLIYHSGEPIARAVFWLSDQEPLPVASKPVRWGVSAILRRRPLLICRSPLADITGLFLPDSPLREAALAAICEAARLAAQKQRASFITFDYLDPRDLAENWPLHNFSPMSIADPGTSLTLPACGFADYIKTLTKSAQKDYRRHTNQAGAREIVVTTHSSVEDAPHALELIRAVENHHQTMPKPWAGNLLNQVTPANSTWLAARQKGELVGCGLLLRDGPVQLATLLGLNYQVQYVYFQLIYSAILAAMQQNSKILRAGSGAYPFKQHLGFALEDNNHLVFSGCGPVFHTMGKYLGRSPQG
jgi:hypothetical protein